MLRRFLLPTLGAAWLAAACSSTPGPATPCEGVGCAGDDAGTQVDGASSDADGAGDASSPACPPGPAVADAGTGAPHPIYPDPVYADVGAIAARVKTACVDTGALPTHATLDALVPSLLAEAGVAPAGAGACACDWTLRFVPAAPALYGDAQKAWTAVSPGAERYVVASASQAGRATTTLYAAEERGGLYALRAALSLAQKDAADPTARDVPLATIVDGPAVAWRGVVEGMYGGRVSEFGTQYTPGERALLLRLAARLRLNTYVYGPKNDPYAGWIGGKWRAPYPDTGAGAAQSIATAAHEAHANLLRFVWAISPGAQFDWGNYAGDLANIEKKYDSMRALGVEHFALFLDDQSIPASIAQQAQLMNDLDAYVKKGDPSDHLLVVWWDYVGGPDSSTRALGPLVHPDVEIMWTGPCVESCTIDAGDMSPVDSSFERKASLWDNWPTSTGCCNGAAAAPKMTGRSADLASAITGYYANPVVNECGPECGSSLRVSDFTAHMGPIADWSWDPARYDGGVDASYARWAQLLAAWKPLVQKCGVASCSGKGPVYPGWTCDPSKTGVFFCDAYESDCVTDLPCPGGCTVEPPGVPDLCH
jgi:hypothetical protein